MLPARSGTKLFENSHALSRRTRVLNPTCLTLSRTRVGVSSPPARDAWFTLHHPEVWIGSRTPDGRGNRPPQKYVTPYMARRTGFAHLPLHSGRAPAWLFTRMTRLAREIATHVVADRGPEELLRRLSDPFWFQAFGCVLGFDWHSSGVTTTVTGALKMGLKGIEHDLGVYSQGGKGATSRKTPLEIR